jgi:hypothetical protein
MKDFKFLSKNNSISYEGQMASEVINHFHNFIANVGLYEGLYDMTTTIATYKLDTIYYSNGGISRGLVHVYPLNAPDVRITFNINAGNHYPYIIGHTIDFDYQIEYNRFNDETV